MNLLVATLLVCSHADRDVAAAVVASAVAQNVPAELALAVGCVESGLQERNPLGVRDCYRGVNNGRFDSQACIVIGVRSLSHRLSSCHGDELCAARRYNNSKHAKAYARKVGKIAAVIRRLVGQQ